MKFGDDDLKNKSFLAGILVIIVVVSIIGIRNEFISSQIEDQMIDGLTIFDKIEDLAFLKSYEVKTHAQDKPEHVTGMYSVSLNYEGNKYDIVAYTFDSKQNAWLYFCGQADCPKEYVAHYRLLVDNVNNTESISATEGCSYYEVKGYNNKAMPQFMEFFCEHMDTPVYKGGL